MNKAEKVSLALLAVYVLIAIVTFGHASVRQDRLEAEYMAKCKLESTTCVYFGGIQVTQAVLWPFYVSYLAWGGK